MLSASLDNSYKIKYLYSKMATESSNNSTSPENFRGSLVQIPFDFQKAFSIRPRAIGSHITSTGDKHG
jgi:hypothetical protein